MGGGAVLAIGLLTLGQVIAVATDFEGGSLGAVEHVGPAHLRCAVQGQADQDNRNRQASWYYFRVSGLPTDRDVRIDLTDLVGEYNYRPGAHAVTPATRPVFSLDGQNWTHFDDAQVVWDEAAKELSLRFRPAAETVWIAHVPPYTGEHLKAFEADLRASVHFSRASVGLSVLKREIPLWTITDRTVAEAEKKVVWLMARQHAWEAGTSWVVEGAARYLISDDPSAAEARRRFVFRVFPMGDPDGVARGTVRFNVNGFDLNRNWDVVDRERMPEIAAQRDAMLAWVDGGRPIDLFLTLHNTESEDYLSGPLVEGGPAIDVLARRLQVGLERETAFVDPKGPRDTVKATEPGRMTVIQALFQERRIPSFLMELRVEKSPKLGRCPTTADRLAFGERLVHVIVGAVGDAG